MYKSLLSGSNTSHIKAHNIQAVLLNFLQNLTTSRVRLDEQTTLYEQGSELANRGWVVVDESTNGDTRHQSKPAFAQQLAAGQPVLEGSRERMDVRPSMA